MRSPHEKNITRMFYFNRVVSILLCHIRFGKICRRQIGLPHLSAVRIDIFNALGKRVRTLVNENQAAGHHRTRWNGKDQANKNAASGIYFIRIQAGDFSGVRKMILLR